MALCFCFSVALYEKINYKVLNTVAKENLNLAVTYTWLKHFEEIAGFQYLKFFYALASCKSYVRFGSLYVVIH